MNESETPLQTCQLWEDDGCSEITLSTKEGCDDLAAQGLLGDNPVMVLEFQAASWEEACQRKHDHYGWKPYVPM